MPSTTSLSWTAGGTSALALGRRRIVAGSKIDKRLAICEPVLLLRWRKLKFFPMADKGNIRLPKGKIAAFCRKHHIRKLAFFGSILRDDFSPSSDVDVLVEFEPGHTPGLDFFAMEAELSAIVGRKVDLNTSGSLSKYFREQALAEAEVQYVAPRS